MRLLFVLSLLFGLLFGADELKIATYNVENLFDLNPRTERYKEYKPNGRSLWNLKNYKIKLKNIARVIKDIDADIIALQEVGSLQALKDLRLEVKRQGLYYRHYSITNKKNTTIKVALLSKIPFIYSKDLKVTSSYQYRNILETKLKINGKELYIFNNHWKSKSAPESMRIVSAKILRKRVEQIGLDQNIILLGDFNSHYEEYKVFKRKRKHNDTQGKTGINHVLRTLKKSPDSLYNLWYSIGKDKRYSYVFRGKKDVLDNIIVSPALLDKKGIDYKNGSLTNFQRPYLMKKNKPYRWQVSRGKVRKHKGKGYSDHLAIIAKFVLR